FNTAAESRNRYQNVQVSGFVAPMVDALSRSHDLDAIWAVAFPFDEMTHPSRPTLRLSAVIKRAEYAGTMEHMRVDSLESARSALAKSSHYSDWTERSYAPLLELLDIAVAARKKLSH
ncbi:MAG: hypothetical protein ABIZ09_04790, partial [Rhodoferax sp.]